MRYSAALLAAFLLSPLCAHAEVSILKDRGGRAVHFLKITEPDLGRIWQPVSLGQPDAAWLNPDGDRNGDLAPVVFIATGNPGGGIFRSLVSDVPDFDLFVAHARAAVVSYALPLTPDLDIVAVWSARDSGGYRLCWSTWIAEVSAWSRPRPVTSVPSSGAELNPAVRAEADGRLLLTWTEVGATVSDWGSLWTGNDWSRPFPLQVGGGSRINVHR